MTSITTRSVPAAGTVFLLRELGAGDATPVLLLHGVPQTSSMWRDLMPRLATGRRVLAPDLPGLGGSSYSGPYDVPLLVAQVVALLEVELPGQRVDVVGHDWGGVIALALTGRHPHLVRRLAVANAPFRTVNPLRAAHIPFFALPVLPELAFRLAGARAVEVMLDTPWKAPAQLDREVRAEYVAAYSEPAKVEAMLAYYRAAARPQVLAPLGLAEAPPPHPRVRAEKMLVLWGAADPVLPISVGESVVADLGPDCVMVTVPGAGHYVIDEAPDVVAEALVEFLAEPASSVASPPVKKPAAKASAKKAPAKKAPAKKAPAEKAPAKKAPAKKAPGS